MRSNYIPPNFDITPRNRTASTNRGYGDTPGWASAIARNTHDGRLRTDATLPSGDIADRLPERAAAKFRRMRDRDADALTVTRDLSDKRNAAIMDRTRATHRVRQL